MVGKQSWHWTFLCLGCWSMDFENGRQAQQLVDTSKSGGAHYREIHYSETNKSSVESKFCGKVWYFLGVLVLRVAVATAKKKIIPEYRSRFKWLSRRNYTVLVCRWSACTGICDSRNCYHDNLFFLVQSSVTQAYSQVQLVGSIIFMDQKHSSYEFSSVFLCACMYLCVGVVNVPYSFPFHSGCWKLSTF